MKEKREGYTLIEVALVLVIAGLIFTMAFFALPTLWRSQRDADRKSRVMEVVTAIKNYQTNNNRGALPALNGSGPEYISHDDIKSARSNEGSWKSVIKDYIGENFYDPEDTERYYSFYVVECLGSSGNKIGAGEVCAYRDGDFGKINAPGNVDLGLDYTMYIAIGATCDGDHAIKTNSLRAFAVLQTLERGGRHCYNG